MKKLSAYTMHPTVLWVNPSFADYRVPFYRALSERLRGKFHLVYSENRVAPRCIKKIQAALGSHAHGLSDEKCLTLGNCNSHFSCSSLSIPYPSGLNKLLRSIKADVVIAEGFFQWTPWALLHARRLRVPLLIAYERTAHTERNCPSWRSLYRKWISRFTSAFLVNGSLCREYLIQSLGVKSDIITEGIMAADSDELSSGVQELRSGNASPTQGITWLYVGRLIELKGIHQLLNAWQEHMERFPHDKLIIVGDGPERAKLEAMNTPATEFRGPVDYDHIHKHYAQADVFIIPTLEDNWSLVVPEAMACGLPIACSCYNGCHPELVKDGLNGKVFDPLNRESILDTLAYFHSASLPAMSKASREIAELYSPYRCANRACDGILQTLIK